MSNVYTLEYLKWWLNDINKSCERAVNIKVDSVISIIGIIKLRNNNQKLRRSVVYSKN